MIKAWMFRTLGNICYRFNGSLKNLHNESWLDKLAFRAWAVAYFAEEKASGRL